MRSDKFTNTTITSDPRTVQRLSTNPMRVATDDFTEAKCCCATNDAALIVRSTQRHFARVTFDATRAQMTAEADDGTEEHFWVPTPSTEDLIDSETDDAKPHRVYQVSTVRNKVSYKTPCQIGLQV